MATATKRVRYFAPSNQFDPMKNYATDFEHHMKLLDDFELCKTLEVDFDDAPCFWDVQLEQAWNLAADSLRCLMNKWRFFQRRAAFAIPTPLQTWDSYGLQAKFRRMYNYLMKMRQYIPREAADKMSMIIEWPQEYFEWVNDGTKRTVIDRAPLVMEIVESVQNKVRHRYPTVQLRVLALNKNNAAGIKALFVAHLVTQESEQLENEQDKPWKSVGKLVITKKEGENEKKKKTDLNFFEHERLLVMNCGLKQGKGSPLTFADSDYHETTGDADETRLSLCASFSEIGAKLKDNKENGPTKNKKKTQFFCIEIECTLQFADALPPLQHTIRSHPFLIADNAEHDMIGHLLCDVFLPRTPSSFNAAANSFKWHDIKLFFRHFVQSQSNVLRPLDKEELLHIQCMFFLPLAVGNNNLRQLECQLFGNERDKIGRMGITKIKYRLLREFVLDNFEITEGYLLTEHCVDLRNCVNRLDHTVLEWLFTATKMIADSQIGKKLCPGPEIPNKKQTSMTTMTPELFNKKLLTMSSQAREWKLFKTLHKKNCNALALLLRFSDWKVGHLSIAYTNLTDSSMKPTYGIKSKDEIKAFDKGLVGMLMTASYPRQFGLMVCFDGDDVDGVVATNGRQPPLAARCTSKNKVFQGFAFSTQEESSAVFDPFEIDPLTGPTLNQPLVVRAQQASQSAIIDVDGSVKALSLASTSGSGAKL